MTMQIRQTAGDSSISGGIDSGLTTIPSTGLTPVIRIPATAVSHSSLVTATGEPTANTYDVVIYNSNITVANVLSFEFACNLVASNSSVLIPIVYVKLVGGLGASGAGYDLVIPMTPGQIFTWVNPSNAGNVQPCAAYDANGAAMSIGANQKIAVPQALVTGPILKISVTPDKYSDVTVSGTFEMST